MEPATVAALHRARRPALGRCDRDVEITLEANPTSVEAANFAELAAAGVNRLSLGIQALDDAALRFLGRGHSADEALAALGAGAPAFPALQLRSDLCPARADGGGLDGGARAGARPRRRASLALSADHRGEHGLRRGLAARRFRPADEEAAAELYEITQARLAAAGLPAYEISNHARPGAECRHNLVYWQGGDYLGVGPGAHGRVTLGRRSAMPPASIARPRPGSRRSRPHGHASGEHRRPRHGGAARRVADDGPAALAPASRASVSRRSSAGRSRRRWRPRACALLIEGGFLELDAAGLRATAEGRQRLDALLPRLLG